MVTFALAVPRIVSDTRHNLETILRMVQAAADAGADLVLFAEAALTGLINNDDPAHDIPLAQPIPGPATEAFAAAARARHLWLGVGLLEREGSRLYDTAVLFSPAGDIVLKYRRISPGWHGRQADPLIYGHGVDIPTVQTPWGKVAFLLCGDLFAAELVQRVRTLGVDWVLLPFARAFDDGIMDQARWDREEMEAYCRQVRAIGVTTLLVNYLAGDDLEEDSTCGGAWVISADGEVLARYPLGQEGLLSVTLPAPAKLSPI